VLENKLSSYNARGVFLVEWNKFHLTITVKVHDNQLLSDLCNHWFFTLDTKLKLFDAEPLVLQIMGHISLADLEVSHVSSLFMVSYFSALGEL
jgi:hypothetical protein